ncbi:MAG: L-2-amino-thiazoline-4-carboxylic acid hydrolase [Deltaproteobacteria bacterium]|nr:L-2-amino-thiazoline-4-carboxylic acid hydrolase [Deltaproteobacteria bacterium]
MDAVMPDAGKRVAEATRQRAAVLAHLFRVLRDRLGEVEAASLMSDAIYAHGREKAKKTYSLPAQSGNLLQAAREFASPDPVKQYQFAPRIVSADDGEAVIAMSRCPLVDQWKEMGLAAEDVTLLCRIARSVDFGTWEGALGFRLLFEGTRGEGKEECLLRVFRKRTVEVAG